MSGLNVVHVLTRFAGWLLRHRWLMAVGAVVAVLAVGWLLFVPTADWLATHDAGHLSGAQRLQARDAARGRLLTFGAGVFAIGALWFTARNFVLSREGQVTDRYTKAIEQLGSATLDVRIGGIYGLERIARDSARDHPTVMEVLAAFIREHSGERWPPQSPGAGESRGRRTTRPDVQAALTVIGRRDYERDRDRIDLHFAVLPFASLSGATFRNAYLYDVNLEGTDLSSADFTDAILMEAIMTRARIFDADLSRGYLAHANLQHAQLQNAKLRDAVLVMADLTNASLSGADLTGAELFGAILSGADFDGADLTNARWPSDAEVPPGWSRRPDSGLLRRASGDAPT